MEQSFDQIADKCGKQLDAFQRCLLANRSETDGGQSACRSQRNALTSCASDAVPLVAAIKRRCQPQIQVYDACIAAKPGRPIKSVEDENEELSERCTPALRSLWKCTELARREEAEALGIKPPEPASVGMAQPKQAQV